jgi:hypothetical protein
MLQRPQTLYLLGVFILSLLLLTGPVALFTLDGAEYILKHTGIFQMDGNRMEVATWPMSAMFILVTTLAFLNIFFYRNRIHQMRICIFMILLHAGTVVMIFYYIAVARNHLEGAQVIHQWRIVIPPIAIILIYMAFRRIRRDELLVKAYDRIR